MKTLIKKTLFLIAPKRATAFFSARARAHSHRVVAAWGNDEVVRKLLAEFGSVVQEGPFAGMILPPETHREQIGPYLLGTYESELDGAWEKIFQHSYRQIIDVGSKFGYYAIGLARRNPAAEVFAFDSDPWARQATIQTAKANNCANIKVREFCDAGWLKSHVDADALIISDCEGYEAQLFPPSLLPSLTRATLLIETHEFAVPGITEKLRRDFENTHEISEFSTSTPRREPSRFPTSLTPEERNLARCEVRDETRWLLCLPTK